MITNIPSLESERLKLIPLSLVHLSDTYVSWMNDARVIAHLESGGNYTLDTLKEFLSDVEKKAILFWAIHLKSTNKHIGNIKIDPINAKHGFGEYGILMGDTDEWGKGYAKEASELVIEYCFDEEINLRKITLGVQAKNVSAVALYTRLGFKIEGKYIKHVRVEFGYDDILRMAIFNPKYD